MKLENVNPTIYHVTIFGNNIFENSVKYLKNTSDTSLDIVNEIIPYTVKKYSKKEIRIKDYYSTCPDEFQTRTSIQNEDIIVFQDDEGNYIQIVTYGKESVILKVIKVNENDDSFLRTKVLINAAEEFFMDAVYIIPPMYIRFNGKVNFGSTNIQLDFQRKIEFLQDEFAFKVLFMDEEPQTALLARPQRYKPMVEE